MSDRRLPGVHVVPAAVAPLLLVGIAFGAEAGWATNLVALVLVGALVRRVQPGLARGRERGLPGLGVLPGLSLTALGLVSALVLGGALAYAVGEVLVTYPGALWAGPVLVLAALVRGKARGLASWGLALALGLAGWLGDGLEEEGELAHGYAHSGPIAGVHPFQMTAVVIDGYGPIDLPINDYVEPDGSRGYGPQELAQTLERTLHAIADIHFPDGPARARKAFGEAEVELGELPQLYDETHNPLSIGFRVASGTHGERSRVEFVCPGQVLDPRVRRPDTVMRDTCPDKYAAEGSAGLGLTGRWAGYTEGRGNARQSLARLVGATRTDDARGRRVVGHERLALAILVLASGLALARRRESLTMVASTAGAAGLLGLLVGFVALVAFVREPVVPAVGSALTIGWGAGAALAAVTGLAGLIWIDGDRRRDGSAWVAAAVGFLALGSAWSLASPTSAVALARVDGPAALVELLADRASLASGLDVQGLEGAFGAVVVAVLAGAAITVLDPLTQAAARLGLDVEDRPRWPAVLVAAFALALVWSGAPGRVLLLLGAGSCAMMASAVSLASRRIDGLGVGPDLAAHVALCGVTVWSMVVSLRAGVATGWSVFSVALAVGLALASLGVGLAKPAERA